MIYHILIVLAIIYKVEAPRDTYLNIPDIEHQNGNLYNENDDFGYSLANSHNRLQRAVVYDSDGIHILQRKKKRIIISRCCGKKRCLKKYKTSTPLDRLKVTFKPKKSKKKKKKKSTTAEYEEQELLTTAMTEITTLNIPPVIVTIASVVTTVKPVETTLQASTVVATTTLSSTVSTTENRTTITTSTVATTTMTTTTSTRPTTKPTTTTLVTTTRCTPICPTCMSRNASLWNAYGNLIDSHRYGTWTLSCNKTYLFSHNSTNFQTAFQACCSIGMRLITFETKNELQCIYNANNALTLPVNGTWWTSAWDEGCKNDSLQFTWCGRMRPMVETFWMTGEPDNLLGKESCSTVIVNAGQNSTNVMSDRPCSFMNSYICGGPTTTCSPECPNFECTTQLSLFSGNGLVMTESSIGSWHIPTYASCRNDTQYLFTSIDRNFEDAMKFCCSIGMQLLSIETPGELKCLSDINNYEIQEAKVYLTSGCNSICNSGYKWCAANVSFYSNFPWAEGQPSVRTGEHCAQMFLNTGPVNGSVFADYPRTDSIPFICEGPLTTCHAECPDVECTTQLDLFLYSDELMSPERYGFWHTPTYSTCTNDTMYLFSGRTADVYKSTEVCCKLGMILLAIETSDELQCLSDLVNDQKQLENRYWTSASNAFCKDKYKWCSINSELHKEMPWKKGPNNFDANEWCGQLELNTGVIDNIVMDDYSCLDSMYFICKGPTTTCSPVCLQPYCTSPPLLSANLIPTSVPDIFVIPEYPTCEKNKMYRVYSGVTSYLGALEGCCSMNMQLLAIETGKEMQCLLDLNKNELKLSNSYWTSGSNLNCTDNFKWCTSGIKFYNNVTWALYEPTLINSMKEFESCVYVNITNLKMEIYSEPCYKKYQYICEGPTTTTSTCNPLCPIYESTTNGDLFDDTETLIDTSSIGLWKTPIYATCSDPRIKYLFSSSNKTYEDAMMYCTQIGMQLLSIETETELQCLSDLNNADMKYKGIPFWTSSTNKNCTIFEWCTSNIPEDKSLYPTIPWALDQPDDNTLYMEFCVEININNGTFDKNFISQALCTKENRFICEVIKMSKRKEEALNITLQKCLIFFQFP